VILGGRIVETGGIELAHELHSHGYDRIRRAYPAADAANEALLRQENDRKNLQAKKDEQIHKEQMNKEQQTPVSTGLKG
jgi:hypothetical protein